MSQEEVTLRFETAWKQGPFRKLGKQDAAKRFARSVKTDEDYQQLLEAERIYAAYCRANAWYTPMWGQTFMGRWRDWLKLEEKPEPRALATLDMPVPHDCEHICPACPEPHTWTCHGDCAMTKTVACPAFIERWKEKGEWKK